MSRATSLSPQDFLLLDQWGRLLWEAFDETPYLVGSVLAGGAYRDVDVRMLAPDGWLDAPPGSFHRVKVRLRTVNLCVTLWGRQVTALPLDFQFQPPDEFHKYDGERRGALGIRSRLEADE